MFLCVKLAHLYICKWRYKDCFLARSFKNCRTSTIDIVKSHDFSYFLVIFFTLEFLLSFLYFFWTVSINYKINQKINTIKKSMKNSFPSIETLKSVNKYIKAFKSLLMILTRQWNVLHSFCWKFVLLLRCFKDVEPVDL